MATQLADIACKTCHHKDCDGSQGAVVGYKFEGEIIKRCPLTLLTEKSALLIEQYPHYENGYLPGAGGILDQTAIYVQGMNIINSEIMKHREEEAKERKGKSRG